VAKHATELTRQEESEDIFDWVRACKEQVEARADQELANWIQLHMPEHLARRIQQHGVHFRQSAEQEIERPFVPTMSLATVRRLCADWHEALAKIEDAKAVPFPEPWFPAAPLVNGYQIVPITDSAELYREGRAMHNCVGSYDQRIIAGDTYIYGIRDGDKRIATVEIKRGEDNKAKIGQIRAPCNEPAPKEINAAARRWLRAQKNELPPCLPAPRRDHVRF
jgi:hypothetical protein